MIEQTAVENNENDLLACTTCSHSLGKVQRNPKTIVKLSLKKCCVIIEDTNFQDHETDIVQDIDINDPFNEIKNESLETISDQFKDQALVINCNDIALRAQLYRFKLKVAKPMIDETDFLIECLNELIS